MGLFSAILGDLGSDSAPSASGSSSSQSIDYTDDKYYSTGPRQSTYAGIQVSPDLALRISTVYAAVNLLSSVLASLDFTMQQVNADGDWTDAPNHPLSDLLLYQPNSWQTAFDFKAMMMHHLVMRGNCYAEIVSGARGAVDSLNPLHPDRVQVKRVSDGSLIYIVNDLQAGVSRTLLAEEVFHIRCPTAPGGIYGTGPLAYAMQDIGGVLAAQEHGQRMFANGARPSGVVEVPKRMSDDAWNRFKESIRQNNSGLRNSNKTLFLEEGATFKAIQMTADELQFLGLQAFQVEIICRWFNVPAVLVHHTDNATSFGTGIEAIMLAFVKNNLMPWLVAWEQAARRDLITAKRNYRAKFDIANLTRGDSQTQAKFFQLLTFAGILTRNDGRRALGYNPLPGLDVPLVPVTQAAPMDKPVPGQSAEPPDPTEDEPPDDGTDPAEKPPVKKPTTGKNSAVSTPAPKPRKKSA